MPDACPYVITSPLLLQAIFQQTHPVHYLDSKSQGVGVALTLKPTRTPAVARRYIISACIYLFIISLQTNFERDYIVVTLSVGGMLISLGLVCLYIRIQVCGSNYIVLSLSLVFLNET